VPVQTAAQEKPAGYDKHNYDQQYPDEDARSAARGCRWLLLDIYIGH